MTILRTRTPEEEARLKAMVAEEIAQNSKRQAERPKIEAEGVAALKRLLPVAQSDTGQSRVIARFLLGCYNGMRFPFDLTDFRSLDYKLFDDCMAVLKMDAQPRQEVHCYIENGGEVFEQLAKDWGLSNDGK